MGNLVILAVITWLLLAWNKTKNSRQEAERRALLKNLLEAHAEALLVAPIVGSSFWPDRDSIKTEEARRLYRAYLKSHGGLIGIDVSEDLADELQDFSCSMEMHEEKLIEDVRFCVADGKEKVAELKRRIAEAKSDLVGVSNKDETMGQDLMGNLEDLSEMLVEERADLAKDLENVKAVLSAFRNDKREFLIEAINSRFHGSDWRSKMTDE